MCLSLSFNTMNGSYRPLSYHEYTHGDTFQSQSVPGMNGSWRSISILYISTSSSTYAPHVGSSIGSDSPFSLTGQTGPASYLPGLLPDFPHLLRLPVNAWNSYPFPSSHTCILPTSNPFSQVSQGILKSKDLIHLSFDKSLVSVIPKCNWGYKYLLCGPKALTLAIFLTLPLHSPPHLPSHSDLLESPENLIIQAFAQATLSAWGSWPSQVTGIYYGHMGELFIVIQFISMNKQMHKESKEWPGALAGVVWLVGMLSSKPKGHVSQMGHIPRFQVQS